jgi:hypothetical protein
VDACGLGLGLLADVPLRSEILFGVQHRKPRPRAGVFDESRPTLNAFDAKRDYHPPPQIKIPGRLLVAGAAVGGSQLLRL